MKHLEAKLGGELRRLHPAGNDKALGQGFGAASLEANEEPPQAGSFVVCIESLLGLPGAGRGNLGMGYDSVSGKGPRNKNVWFSGLAALSDR